MEYNSQHQLVERFTDDMYARKEDVRKALNTSLIDPIWTKIIAYRRSYYKNLNITDIAKRQYYICYIDKIRDVCNEIITKINTTYKVYSSLDDMMKKTLKDEINGLIIKGINHLYSNQELKEEFIALVNKNQTASLQGLSLDKMKAINYFQFLSSLKSGTKVDEDYLINLYSHLAKNNNLVRLYRDFDFASAFNQERNGVSHHQIERMMNELYAFLLDANEPIIIRAIMSYYYINYVKPFDAYNQEIALLVFKTLLANDTHNDIFLSYPIEFYFTSPNCFVHENKEAERTNDFTYFLLKTIALLDETLACFTNRAEKIHVAVLTTEHDLKTSEIINEINSKNTSLKGIEKSVVVEKAPTNIKEEEKVANKPVAVIPIEKVKVVQKKENLPTINKEIFSKNVNLTAVVNIDEKDANRFAKYLLEKNPLLRPKEAHFYARHSTLGSYYTIQMYKNFEHVVYETARTSMDALAKFGYYKKEQIKNKFVYTPNKIEGK